MRLSPRMRRVVAGLCAFLLLGTTTLPAAAAMVGTEQVIQEARADLDREHVLEMLDRDDVRSQLEAMGVDPAEAKARVDRMTDAEIATLAEHLDELPAGSGVLTAVVIIFIVFVITDVVGATDIFPFIRSVN